MYKDLNLINENIEIKNNKNIALNLNSSCKAFVFADAFHFYNILYNIIDNAVKYGTEKPEIAIAIKPSTNYYSLQISDNGPGIPEKDLPFIFDKFYRVKRKDSEEIEGFGIGLAYVKKICILHNWKISVKNGKTGLLTEIVIPKKDVEYA